MGRGCSRRGFTLIELLVVLAVIAVLVGLLLPAVQEVRAAAARVKCANNMKQVGLALLNHESAFGSVPEGYRFTTPTRSFVPPFLPFLEQGNVPYDPSRDWDDPANRAATRVQLAVLYCPATPDRNRLDPAWPFDPACSDYTVYHGVNPGYCDIVGWPYYSPAAENGVMTSRPCKLTDITDGTSSTFLVVEDAGRPALYRMGRGPSGLAANGGWADPNLEIALDGSDTLTTTQGQGLGPCVMNCTNDNELYAFHTGGENFAFADGSVRFLRERIENRTFAALVTKAAGDIPGDGW